MQREKGFTFVELILTIAIIGIVVAGAVVIINPAQRFRQNYNAQRAADISKIINAVYNYTIDNNGDLPSNIQTGSDCFSMASFTQICKTGVANLSCVGSGAVSLSELTNNSKYIDSMPIDPENESANGTGYYILKDVNGKVTVCAPLASDTTISLTR